MTGKLRWGIMATGNIAAKFAGGVAHSKTGVVQAVASRNAAQAAEFAAAHAIPNAHEGYAALLDDASVDAVYIATPHPMHAEWAVKAAEAGKHVLCEKPLTLNAPTAMAVIDAAERNGVFLMEAYMYRCHPQTLRLIELLRAKTIGTVLSIEAAFSFNAAFNPDGRLYAPHLGGGGILDIGGYTVSMARLVAGVALGGEIAEPLEFKAVGRLAPTGVDADAAAAMRFPGDILAQVACGIGMTRENIVKISGTEGVIVVPWPWIPAREGGTSRLELTGKDGVKRDIRIETKEWLYGIEADTVAYAVAAGRRQAVFPAPDWNDTLNNMLLLDRWREEVNVVYPAEKPGAVPTIDGRPLCKSAAAVIPSDKIAGVAKPVSRLVMGVDNQRTLSHAAVMFDEFFRAGGNCFDTARVYGNCEAMLGQWIRERGLREQVVILDKGAHTPYCTPDYMNRQLDESLEQLQTDYVDIYMFHRDNTDVPVGEFVAAVNERIGDGSVRSYGFSNWTIERITQAIDYAVKNGLPPPVAISNHFSLARMIEPVWEGCLAVSDPVARAWLEDKRIPLLPWSSQARGFFSERGAPGRTGDAEMERCWQSADNRQRRERAVELAGIKGVRPTAVALAYVLCQSFPVFPLIGPRQLREMRVSLQALSVKLTPAEIAWLNLESERRD